MINDTSNPAFPHDGMTLRDYFAAKAMQALIPAGETIETMKYAESAYAMADAMLKARRLPPYTTPQPQEFVCSNGFCRFTLTQTGVGIGERGMQAYEEAKKRGWVGISDELKSPQPSEKGVSNEHGDC